MNNESKMKTGVALALGVLAEAEADVVSFQPNLAASDSDLFGVKVEIDPFNQLASSQSISSSIGINYWCWGNYLDGNGSTDEDGNVGEFQSVSSELNDVVSSSSDFTPYTDYLDFRTSHTSEVPKDFYLGFRLSNTNSPDEYNYGYVNFTARHQDSTCYLTLNDVAYESEVGMPITISAIPELTSGLLMIISILLFGISQKAKYLLHGNR